MGSFSIMHWIIFAVVVIAIFGTSKLKNAGKDLGSAVKGFKDAVKEEDDKTIKSLDDNRQNTATVEEIKQKTDV